MRLARRIPRLRLVYIASMVILGLLVVITVVRPSFGTEQRLSESQVVQLLERQDDWVLELNLVNRETDRGIYTIKVDVDGTVTTQGAIIERRALFKYIQHIRRAQLTAGVVKVTVYRDDRAEPVEQVTYALGR